MGSWVAHEFVREIARTGSVLPVSPQPPQIASLMVAVQRKMYLSGIRAPSLAGIQNDVDTVNPSLHDLPKVCMGSHNDNLSDFTGEVLVCIRETV